MSDQAAWIIGGLILASAGVVSFSIAALGDRIRERLLTVADRLLDIETALEKRR